ncbi:MAG: amino acid permease [bacterium]
MLNTHSDTTQNHSTDIHQEGRKAFGTFQGVYLPSVLTILGVIMYLRLGWVIGNAGLIGTIVIVTFSSLITFLTGLSISATATNMKVGGGGAYFMISRSFGVEAGAAVGFPLFLAQAIGISFYIAGFAESVHSIFPKIPFKLIGVVSLIILTVLAYISADIALKAQLFIFSVIIVSLFSFFLGRTPAGGFVTSSGTVIPKASFWAVFAVFFPAVTGIEAGIAMSGDLKDPAQSLPSGTLFAIVTGYVIYLAIPLFLYFKVPSEVLRSNYMIIKDIALIGVLILFGIWGATLSSALGALLGAPRTLQALARDRVLPRFLGKGSGVSDTPRIATIFSFLIALGGILLGDINAIAPVLSMFFLTSYGVLNLVAGFEGLIGNPSWRPTFKTPWYLSLLGAGLCMGAMFMIDSGATFIALCIIFSIYFVMIRRDLNARWSDMRRSILLFFIRYSIYRLDKSLPDARSWRPNILVLSGSPTQRFYLIQLADAITHGKSLLTVASIISNNEISSERVEKMEKSIKEYLIKRDIPSLIEITTADSFLEGVKSLAKTYGLGLLYPNTYLFGETEEEDKFIEFAEIIKTLYQLKRNIIIVREGETVEKKHPKDKRIYVWWRGKQNNANLMLTLAYMLQTSPEWKGAKLILKIIVKSEEGRRAIIENVNNFLSESRLRAESEILVEDHDRDSVARLIKTFSKDGDLIFLGMKPPWQEESIEEYAEYYKNLLKQTKNFPPLALILAGEEQKFSEVFQ